MLKLFTNSHDCLLLQLLKNKCPVNGVNNHGNTPLHYACFWNSEECAEVRYWKAQGQMTFILKN